MTVRVAGVPRPFHHEGSRSQLGMVAEARMVVRGACFMMSFTRRCSSVSKWMPGGRGRGEKWMVGRYFGG